MKNIILTILLVIVTYSYSQNKDITITSNDSTIISGHEIEFKPLIIPALDSKDTLRVVSSDTNVVKLKQSLVKSGETAVAIVKDFGTVWIKISPKDKNSSLVTGFKINVKNQDKTNKNELAHGIIYTRNGQSQYAQMGSQKAKFESLLATFHTKKLIKNSQSVRVYWDVIPDQDKVDLYGPLTTQDIIQFYNTSEDSTDVFFKLSGNHTLLLVATDGTKKDTISSFKYSRIGDDFRAVEYSVALDDFIARSNNLELRIEHATGKYYYIEDQVTYYHNVDTHEDYEMKDYRDNEIYRIKKLKDGLYWTLDNMRYEPASGDFIKPANSSTIGLFYEENAILTNASDTTSLYVGSSSPYDLNHHYQSKLCPNGWVMHSAKHYMDLFKACGFNSPDEADGTHKQKYLVMNTSKTDAEKREVIEALFKEGVSFTASESNSPAFSETYTGTNKLGLEFLPYTFKATKSESASRFFFRFFLANTDFQDVGGSDRRLAYFSLFHNDSSPYGIEMKFWHVWRDAAKYNQSSFIRCVKDPAP
jgi:uncharacterized protein (TIGR02145 family)